MYVQDTTQPSEVLVKDKQYWQDLATAAHQWSHVVHLMWMQAHRAHEEGRFSGSIWRYLDELDNARRLFNAEYAIAMAYRDSLEIDCPIGEFVRELCNL